MGRIFHKFYTLETGGNAGLVAPARIVVEDGSCEKHTSNLQSRMGFAQISQIALVFAIPYTNGIREKIRASYKLQKSLGF